MTRTPQISVDLLFLQLRVTRFRKLLLKEWIIRFHTDRSLPYQKRSMDSVSAVIVSGLKPPPIHHLIHIKNQICASCAPATTEEAETPQEPRSTESIKKRKEKKFAH